MATHLGAMQCVPSQLRSTQRPFRSGRSIRTINRVHLRTVRQQQQVQALFGLGKKAQQPEEQNEQDKEAEKPPGLLKGLFGGAKIAAAEAEDVVQEVQPRALQLRAGSQRIKAQAQRSGVARPQRSQAEFAEEGTQRFSMRKLFGGGKRGGTTRIGGRSGGTRVIGGKGSRGKQGPRGLFGGKSGRRDEGTVFVAGGTGRLGARIVRQLLQQGLKVRAGVRDVEKAQGYLDTAIAYGLLPKDASRRVTLIECDVTQPETLAASIGTAAKVVSAIGAADGLNFGAPKKIDGEGGINLVKAAQAAGVQHFVMVSSLGTGKFGWPAGVLNLFGGVLTQKKRAEEALEASGLRYTIVRPGGMERPQDDYGETRALVFKQRDQLFGGQVSRLQVSQVIGTAIANSELAENKVLEVVAEETAPRREVELMLADMEPEASQESRSAIAEATREAQQQLDDATAEESSLAQQYEDLQERLSDMYDTVEDAPNQRAAKRAERDIEKVEAQLESIREASEDAQTQQSAATAVLKAAKAAAKSRSSFSAEQAEQIREDVFNPPTSEELQRRKDVEAQAKADAEQEVRAERQRVADEAREAREAEAAQQRQASEAEAKKAKAEVTAKADAEAKQKKSAADEKARKDAADKKQREEAAAEADAEAKQKKAAEDAKARKEAAIKAEAEAKQKEAAEDDKAKKEADKKQREETEAKFQADKDKQEKQAARDRAAADAQGKREAAEKKAADENAARKKAAAEQKAAAAQTGRASAAQQEAAAEGRADKQFKAAESAAKVASIAKSAAEKKAEKSAAEARQWISDWRQGGSGAQAAPQKRTRADSGNGVVDRMPAGETRKPAGNEEKAAGGLFGGLKWPWQQETVYAEDPSSQSKPPERQSGPKIDPRPSIKTMAAPESTPSESAKASGAAGARKWIDDWRKRTQ